MEAEIIKMAECIERIERVVQTLAKTAHKADTSYKLAYTTDEAIDVLGLQDRRKLDELRKNGLIRGTLTGKSYIYARDELERFIKTYNGYNLSNTDNQMIALAQVSKARR